jgi:hypothetical protein
MVRPRVRTCWAARFGKGSYACGGKLEPVRRKATPLVQLPPGKGLGWYLTEAAATTAQHDAYRLKAVKELAKARQQLGARQEELQKTSARLLRLIHKYQTKEAYWAKRASLTNEQLDAERAAKKTKAEARASRRVKRAMAI